MDLAAYLGSVISVVVIALGAMYALTRQVGDRIGDLHLVVNTRFDDVNNRFDDMNNRFDDVNRRIDGLDVRLGGVESRLARVEVRLDGFHDSLVDFGDRLSRHERDHPQA